MAKPETQVRRFVASNTRVPIKIWFELSQEAKIRGVSVTAWAEDILARAIVEELKKKR